MPTCHVGLPGLHIGGLLQPQHGTLQVLLEVLRLKDVLKAGLKTCLVQTQRKGFCQHLLKHNVYRLLAEPPDALHYHQPRRHRQTHTRGQLAVKGLVIPLFYF